MADDYKVQIGAVAGGGFSEIESRIAKICKSQTITFNADLNGVLSDLTNIEKKINSINKLKINPTINSSAIQNINNAVKAPIHRSSSPSGNDPLLESRLVAIRRRIGSTEASLKTLSATPGSKSNEIAELKRQLQDLKSTYTDTWKALSNPLTSFKQNALTQVIDDADRKLNQISAKIKDTAKNSAFGIKSKVDSSFFDNEQKKITKAFENAGGSSKDKLGITSVIGDLNSKISTIKKTDWVNIDDSGIKKVIEDYKEYLSLVEKANNLIGMQQADNPLSDVKRNQKIADGFKEKISSGQTSGEITALTQQLNALGESGTQIDQIKSKLAELSAITSSVDDGSSVDDLVAKQKKYNEVLQETKAAIKNIKDGQDLAFKKNNMSNDIDAFLKKNTAAVKKYGAQFETLKKQINEATDPAAVERLNKKLTELKGNVRAHGLMGLSFTDQLKESVTKLLPALSAADLVLRGVDTLKQMAQETVSVDTAMTELKRVTSLSATEYENLYDSMVQSAKKYGAQLDTMINSTASWVRLGFDANTANKLAEVSTMYQHVTDLDEATAVKNLVTAYKGYQDQLLATTNNDSVAAVEKVADIFDKLGNELPVTAAQVGAGMNKWASVAQSAGATIEEAAAMTVGSGSVTQDFDQAGSSLKISTLRIMGMKGALEELGEEVDDDVASISSMQTKILNLTGGAVNIFEKDGKSFRNIFEIFRDIANILPKLDDTDRSQLLETIAGKNRSNSILAMLQNWDEVERALTAANDAAGTAREENDIYMDSIQGKIDSLKASWQALSNTVVDSNILKSGLDLVNGIVDGLDAVVGKIGPIMTIIAGGTAIKSIKSIS